MNVHPTSLVEDGARLGADVEIGPFCIVGAHAVLGDGVRLIGHASVQGHVSIGARSVLHHGAVLGGIAQIRGDDAPAAKLAVGEDCVIREHVTMNLGSRRGGGLTSVGRNGYFMAYSHVGHDCHVGDGVTFANGAQLGGHVEIGDGVIMGGLSASQQRSRVGRHAYIGGLAAVNSDVIPFGIVWGNHARLEGLNLVGLKRRGFSRPAINTLRAAFREIFDRRDGQFRDRVDAAAVAFADSAEVMEIIDFIRADVTRPLVMPARDGAG